MTRQAELLRKIDTLPEKYLGEVIDFVGYLQHKAQQEAAQQAAAPARRELTTEEAVHFKVMPNPKMTAEEEEEYLRKNAEWLNKEAMDVFEDQKWIFESDEGWEKE